MCLFASRPRASHCPFEWDPCVGFSSKGNFLIRRTVPLTYHGTHSDHISNSPRYRNCKFHGVRVNVDGLFIQMPRGSLTARGAIPCGRATFMIDLTSLTCVPLSETQDDGYLSSLSLLPPPLSRMTSRPNLPRVLVEHCKARNAADVGSSIPQL